MAQERIGQFYPNKSIEIVPILFTPYSSPNNDIFSFVNIYDGKCEQTDFVKKLGRLALKKPIDEDTVYVFINTGN